MPHFYIKSNLFGTAQHICINEKNEIGASEIIPVDDWSVTGNMDDHNNLDIMLKLSDVDIDFIPSQWRNMYSFSANTNLPWRHIIPARTYVRLIQDAIAKINNNWEKFPFSYFETWYRTQYFLQSLDYIVIDEEFKHAHDANDLAEFKTGTKFIYDRFGSRTGRLTISSGPNLNSLAAKKRNIFKSRFQNGRIACIDFISLEPRLILIEQGKQTERDIYSIFQKKHTGIPREIIKQFVIAYTYGASTSVLKEILHTHPIDIFLNLYKDVSNVFNVTQLIEKIKSTTQRGSVINGFGRPISLGNTTNYLNTYIQSTAVDIALLGFEKIMTSLSKIGIIPFGILHDGMFVDVPENAIDIVSSIKNVKIEKYSQKLPIKVTFIGDLNARYR